MGPLALLNVVGAGQGLVLAAALAARKRGIRSHNRLLAALLFCVSAFVLGAVSTTTHFYLAHPHTSFLHDPFVLLCAPLLFLYLRSVLTDRPLHSADMWHFAPAGALLLIRMPFYLQSADAKLRYLTAEYAVSYTPYFYWRSSLVIVQAICYAAAIMLLLRRASREDRSRLRLLGSWRLPLTIVVGCVATALLFRLADIFGLLPNVETNLLVPLCATMLTLYAAFASIRREDQPLLSLLHQRGARYRTSTLTSDRTQRCLQRLRQAMDTEQLFRDGELTLPTLSSKLGLPAAHVSQAINEQLGKTFTDYVNSYRVNFAQAALLDPAKAHFSVLAIGEEAGFSSKSSFNAVFKKHAGMTPSEFREARRANGPAPTIGRTAR